MNKEDKKYIESLVGDITQKMPDYDGDGYPDLFDCDPFDPTKDGLVGDAWARMTGAASRAQQAARRVYAPAASRARQTAAHATARVRASAASAQKRVVAYRRAGVKRAAEARASPAPKPRVDIVREYKKVEREVSKRIPTLQRIEAEGLAFSQHHGVREAYQSIGERVLELPEPVKAVGVETFKFTRGSYKEFQQYPVTTAVKTAAFYYAGPAISGVGAAATAGRVALAAKAPTVAKVPVIGKPLVTAAKKVGAPVAEKAMKYALPAMGALWAGSIGQRVYATPAEMRAEEAGRIFMGEVVPMTAAAGIRAAPSIRPTIAVARDIPEMGVERVAKQLFIGKKRIPIGYEKTVSQQMAPSAGKTQLAMESEYKAMVGQLKYTHTRFARGAIEGEYFLPTPPARVQIGKLPITEAGMERLMLPSPAPKPTRLYAEVSKRYIRAREIELAGERQMRWIEAGKRKLEYGVPEPPKYEIPDIGAPPGTWGISGRVQIPRYGRRRPSYPAGLTASEAESLSALAGAPRPKLLPERMYFQETPVTSRYYEPTELLAAMRRTPAAEPIIAVPKPRVTKPPIEPMMERAPTPEPLRRPLEFAEPAPHYEVPWAEPTMKRAPLVEPKRASLPYAEPTPTKFEFPWAEPTVRVAPKQLPTVKPKPTPKRVPKMARVPAPYTTPYKFPEPLVEPIHPPKPTPRKRAYPLPSIYPRPIPTPPSLPSPRRRAYPLPSIYPHPTPVTSPTPYTAPDVPKPTPAPKPTPMPRPTPAPLPKVTRVPPPPPPIPKIPPYVPFMMDDGIEERRPPSHRAEREWKQQHKLITLESLLGYSP